jgi:competence protein ComFC
MIRCLACHEFFIEEIGWRKLLQLEPSALLCPACESELKPISGERCSGCSRSLEKLAQNMIQDGECLDCWRWQENKITTGLLERNLSLFEYNPFFKEWLATYKYRGDAVIASFFSPLIQNLYQKQFKGYLPIAIPLSEERLLARGFNQSALLINDLPILNRQTGEKQSKKSRKQRIQQFKQNPFTINPDLQPSIRQKSIVLVDDVYTTGTTIRQAAKILLEHGAIKVASMTIAR